MMAHRYKQGRAHGIEKRDVWGIKVFAHTDNWVPTEVHPEGLYQQPRDDLMVKVRGHSWVGTGGEELREGRAEDFEWGQYYPNKPFHITHFRIVENG